MSATCFLPGERIRVSTHAALENKFDELRMNLEIQLTKLKGRHIPIFRSYRKAIVLLEQMTSIFTFVARFHLDLHKQEVLTAISFFEENYQFTEFGTWQYLKPIESALKKLQELYRINQAATALQACSGESKHQNHFMEVNTYELDLFFDEYMRSKGVK